MCVLTSQQVGMVNGTKQVGIWSHRFSLGRRRHAVKMVDASASRVGVTGGFDDT